MYQGFKLCLPDYEETNPYYQKGQSLYSDHKKMVISSLERYLSPEGILKADEIEKDWFPKYQADVFLSHSHKDEKAVIAFAGYLSELGLKPFIDSCVWGCAGDLLKQIDNKYCVGKRTDGNAITYDYKSRNSSTAHVHMILNGALYKMIDKTECLLFLDTPNSLQIKDLNKVTGSCWIYSELLMANLVRRNKPRRTLQFRMDESVQTGGPAFEYKVDISHLIPLSIADINTAWYESLENNMSLLDNLYLSKKVIYKHD